MKIGELSLNVFLLIVVNDLLATASQLFMKKGLGQNDYSTPLAFAASLLGPHNPHIFLFWIGALLCILNFFLWMNILSKVDLSTALPVAGVSYILIPIAAVFFLHEHVGLLRWLGILFIIFGIYLISKSKNSEMEKNG